MCETPLHHHAMNVLGFAGWSGSGKTTLIEQLIPRLTAQGLRVSLIKHAHHHFDIDQPGKDSWRHREAGCREVLITSGQRWALMHELRGAPELTLREALQHLSPCDLVLVEGYKGEAIPKLEVHRPELGKPLLQPDDPWIVGIVSDATDWSPDRPCYDLNNPDALVAVVLREARPLD